MNFPLSTFLLRDLVLIGGGHSHVAVLKRFGMKPLPGVRVTLISKSVDTPYSGMLPGLVAGHYAYDDAHIDLERLTRFASARAVFDEAIGLDLNQRQVHFRGRPPISYDVISINVGSTPTLIVPGSAEHAVPVKPIDRFLERWRAVRERLMRDEGPRRLAVVGGGAGGVELLLAVQHDVRTTLRRLGRRDDQVEYHLFSSTATLLPMHNARVGRIFDEVLRERRARVHVNNAVVEVLPGAIRTADGHLHEVDEVLWTTEASAAPWIAESGLAVDDHGFVRVSSTLQSTSHPDVFAAGDIAAMVDHPRPKSGVFAVRQGPPLVRNLRHALLGRRLTRYVPQRQFLSLISTGDKHAVASRGPFAFQGAWVWRWKDRIDRQFMRRYSELPAMARDAPRLPEGLADAEAIAAVSAAAMRCAGCGAKVGATVLSRALERVAARDPEGVLIGLDAPDDAAAIALDDCRVSLQTVDFLPALMEDPYVFGQVAANHALGDIHAMGGSPQSALAVVTIPAAAERKVEETLTHVLAGAAAVLRAAGAALVGGHTTTGAELAVGFAVNGLAHRDRLLRKGGLRPGDCLILTKPIGTGTLFAADMRHQAKGRWIAAATQSMLVSNRDCARVLVEHGATACTDVTGFGLLGHLAEMARASRVEVTLEIAAVPLLDGATETVRAGILSSLQRENLRLRHVIAGTAAPTDDPRFALLFDPQTAGGLLAGVPQERAEACVAELRRAGYPHAAIVGGVVASADGAGTIALR